MGTVDEVVKDEGKTYFHVVYADFDEAEFSLGELWDHVIYHPELDAAKQGWSTATGTTGRRHLRVICC